MRALARGSFVEIEELIAADDGVIHIRALNAGEEGLSFRIASEFDCGGLGGITGGGILFENAKRPELIELGLIGGETEGEV